MSIALGASVLTLKQKGKINELLSKITKSTLQYFIDISMREIPLNVIMRSSNFRVDML